MIRQRKPRFPYEAPPSTFAVGLVLRDTYDDRSGYQTLRHVKLLSREPTGRWLCEAFAAKTPFGEIDAERTDGRKSRLSEDTLRKHYVGRIT